jgi:hypothetical protein
VSAAPNPETMPLGSLCARYTADIKLEEPDITCLFRGAKWGVAAKVLYSRDRDRQIDQIVAGAKQIEGAAVDLGVVIVNASNLVQHDEFFRPIGGGKFGSYPDLATPVEKLKAFAKTLVERFDTKSLVKRLTEDKYGEDRLKTRGVLVFAQSVTSVMGAFATVGVCNFYKFRSVLVGEDDFFDRFNDAAQTAPTHAFP